MKRRIGVLDIEVSSRYTPAATRRLAVAVAVGCLVSGCGGRAPDADPLASIAAAVGDEERTPAPLAESWRREPDVALTLRPAVGERAVYLAQGDRLSAWSAADGSVLWPPVVFDAEITAAPVALGDEVVVATGGDDPRVWWIGGDSRPTAQRPADARIVELGAGPGVLVYIDEHGVGRLGDSEWHTPLDGVQSVALAADQGLVLVTSAPGTLTAFSLSDGAPRWRYDAGGPITRADVAGERLFVGGGGEPGLVALRANDGHVNWRRRLGTTVSGAPAHAQDLVWIAGFDARLHAFKAGNGTQVGELSIDLSSRNYLDLAAFEPWVLVGARYGPWLAVRGPTRAERQQIPARVAVRQPSTVGGPNLSIAAGAGVAGVAVVTSDGSVAFLQPRRGR